MIKELVRKKMIDKDSFSRNIEKYMKRALEKCDTIFFYSIDPLTSDIEQFDKLSWIRKIKHEEFEKIKIKEQDGKENFYQSKRLSDMVIKLDLKDDTVKEYFNNNFKIGTTWARGDIACKIGEGDPLFEQEPGYEFYNFILAREDEVILDAWLHGGFNIGIDENIVSEIDLLEEREH